MRFQAKIIRILWMILTVVVGLPAATYAQTGQPATLAHRVEVSVIVLDAEKTAWTLVDWVDASGGYYTVLSTGRVILRLPTQALGELRGRIEGQAEAILGYEPRAVDVREELAAIRTGIASREESLTLILSYLDDTDVAGTLDLEREVSALVDQIESLKGRERRLFNDTAFAYIKIDLGSRSQSIPEQLPSSFEWINTMSLYRFLEEAVPYGY